MRIEDIQRDLEAFERKTEEYCAEACVGLRYIPTETLREIFGPPFGPERQSPPFFDEDPFYIMCYEVTPDIAERLKPYFLVPVELDFKKYEYYMSSTGDGTAIEEPS